MHALEKEVATNSTIFAWRIPGTEEPGWLLSMGSHRAGRDWSDLATAAVHVSKVMLNILQVRLQQYMNCELPDVQAGFRKGRGTRDQIVNICWITVKTRVPEKHLFLLYWLCQCLWLGGSQENVENSERDGNTRPPDLPLEKFVGRSGNNRLVPNRKRSTSRLYIVTLLI